jgi:RHS repeat-associated protein
MIHAEAQDGVTDTFTLDPDQRALSETNSTTGVTATNIYSDDSDSPTWTSNSDGTWSRNITDLDGDLAESQSGSGTANAALQLVNLHGDIVATAPDSSSDTGYSSYNEDTEFGVPRAATGSTGGQYGWLGGSERSSDDLGGTVQMGERLYNPVTGRFLSTDPVPGGSANRYDYCDQDPINNTDIDGTNVGPPLPDGNSSKNWKIRNDVDKFNHYLKNAVRHPIHMMQDISDALDRCEKMMKIFNGEGDNEARQTTRDIVNRGGEQLEEDDEMGSVSELNFEGGAPRATTECYRIKFYKNKHGHVST